MMKTIKGDLIQIAKHTSLFDIYIHGCNCFSIFGAGIARQIAHTFPHVYKVDKESKLTPHQKFGKFTFISFKNSRKHRIYFINAYTQFSLGGGLQVDYVALRDSMESIRVMFGGCQLRFAMPMIGAGLGGGNWQKIKTIIEDVFKQEDVTVIEYDQ
jgi:O-acetyl-ADP-ribose deacetylase (regulator of RNase III)